MRVEKHVRDIDVEKLPKRVLIDEKGEGQEGIDVHDAFEQAFGYTTREWAEQYPDSVMELRFKDGRLEVKMWHPGEEGDEE